MPWSNVVSWTLTQGCVVVGQSVLRRDIERTYVRLGGGRGRRWIGCLRAPGVQAVIVLRFGQWLLRRHRLVRIVLDPVYHVLNLAVQIVWGIEVPRHAKIGPGFYIGHFGGITISAEAVVGSNCNISQGVTIGVAGAHEKRGVPVIGDDVYIAPGARVFGGISIGNNVKIGANAVVHQDIPDNAIAVLDPGFRVISYKGNRRRAPRATL